MGATISTPTTTHVVNLQALRSSSSQGFLQSTSVPSPRPLSWLLLTGVLPPESDKWREAAFGIKDTYESFVTELLESQPWFDSEEWVASGVFESHRTTPSPPPPTGPYATLRAPPCPNSFLLSEILKDVLRTHPDLSFYISPPQSPRRLLSLTRILYVWSRLNQGVKYVQGMNELAGVAFFALAASDAWLSALGLPPSPSHVNPACEALAYELTSALLTRNVDVYTSGLDSSSLGVQGRIRHVSHLVSVHDPLLSRHLSSMNLNPEYYLLRWVTTLLSREFNMPDVVALWDGMLSANDAPRWIGYVSAVMVMSLRDLLLAEDFQGCMKALQEYPPCDVDSLVAGARGLYRLERSVEEIVKSRGCGIREAMASVPPQPGVVMAFGFRGGEVEPDVGEAVREVARNINQGAGEIGRNVGQSVRRGWGSVVGWGAKMAEKFEDREGAKEKEARLREERARAEIQMKREREFREKEERKRREFLRQQEEMFKKQLEDLGAVDVSGDDKEGMVITNDGEEGNDNKSISSI